MLKIKLPKIKYSKRLAAYFFLTINTICWGAALIIVKPALEITTSYRYLLYRFALAAIFSLPLLFYFLPKIKNLVKKVFTIFILELIGTTLSLSLLYIGLNQTLAIEASLITTTTPIFVVLAGIIFLKEKEEKHELVGLILAFIGTIMLTILPVMMNFGQITKISLTGNLLIIGQNITTALYLILAKKYYQKIPKLFITTISFYVGIFTFLFLSLLEMNFSTLNLWQQIKTDLTFGTVWIAALYMAIFGSIIGLTAYIKGQEDIEASEASLFWYLQPIVYLPLGVILLNEKILPLQIVSLLVIFFGVYLAEKRTK